ncbi:MAG: hypothetical protein HRT90_03640 [Candidatus Margulisbacteria bacterium]|nr:hypothetical protein [Candidatus Margulisiibacteriota bacterium]
MNHKIISHRSPASHEYGSIKPQNVFSSSYEYRRLSDDEQKHAEQKHSQPLELTASEKKRLIACLKSLGFSMRANNSPEPSESKESEEKLKDIFSTDIDGENEISLPTLLKILELEESQFWTLCRWAKVDSLPGDILWACIGHEITNGRSFPTTFKSKLNKLHILNGFLKGTGTTVSRQLNGYFIALLGYRVAKDENISPSTIFKLYTTEINDQAFSSLLNYVPLELILSILVLIPLGVGSIRGCQKRKDSEYRTKELEAIIRECKQYKGKNIGDYYKGFCIVFNNVVPWLVPLPTIDKKFRILATALLWDRNLESEVKVDIFDLILDFAINGHGYTQIEAMQILAKIVHGVHLKDLQKMYSRAKGDDNKESLAKNIILLHLKIKTRALSALQSKCNTYLNTQEPYPENSIEKCLRVTPDLITSFPRYSYARYLLWWSGHPKTQYDWLPFLLLKAGKLTLQGVVLISLINQIIQKLNCPDRLFDFSFGYGFPVTADLFTEDCFNEVIRQFRLVSLNQPIEELLEILPEFHLPNLKSLDLSHKGLTGQDVSAILSHIEDIGIVLEEIDLHDNLIGEDISDISFTTGLKKLILNLNKIGPEAMKRLSMPRGLEYLDLGNNTISSEGVKGYDFPRTLQIFLIGENNISDAGVQNLRIPPSVKRLSLRSNNITESGSSNVMLPVTIEEINLSGNKIGSEWAKKLSQLPRLRVARLNFNQLGDEGIQILFQSETLNRSLVTLNAKENGITEVGLTNLARMKSLVRLRLYGNRVNILNIRPPKQLRDLSVANNQISILPNLDKQFPSLTNLSLGENPISSEVARNATFPKNLVSLYAYDFERNVISAFNFSALDNVRFFDIHKNKFFRPDFHFPQKVEILYLQDNQIGPISIARFEFPPSTHTLGLRGNEIQQGLRNIKWPAKLVDLDLSQNNLTDSDLEGISFPETLEFLNLSRNNIVGGKKFFSTSNLPQLTLLDMSFNNVTGEGVRELNLPAIKFLDISFNNLNTDDMRILSEKIDSLPQLQKTTTLGNPYDSVEVQIQNQLRFKELITHCRDELCFKLHPEVVINSKSEINSLDDLLYSDKKGAPSEDIPSHTQGAATPFTQVTSLEDLFQDIPDVEAFSAMDNPQLDYPDSSNIYFESSQPTISYTGDYIGYSGILGTFAVTAVGGLIYIKRQEIRQFLSQTWATFSSWLEGQESE